MRSTSLLYKNLPANLGLCKPTFYTIYSITPEVKQYYEALFLSYRPWTESSISQFYNTNCTHAFNIQDDRSTRGLLATPLKKFPKSPIRPTGSHFCSASCGRVFEWTLIELHSNIIIIFFISWFYRCVIFKSVWYARYFEYSWKRRSLNDYKQTAQRLKLHERLLTINERNIVRCKIYGDNNFH